MRPVTTLVPLLTLLGSGCILVQDTPLNDGGTDGGVDGGLGCASPTGQLGVSLQVIDFGAVVVKTVPSQIISVSNCTLQDTVVTPNIEGPQAKLFAAARTAPFTLAAGSSLSFTVSYAPLVPSLKDSASLALLFSTGGSAVVPLQGIALQSGLKITPDPLNYGFVQVGDTVALPLHLTNVGNERITVTSVVVVDPGTPAAFSIATGSWTGATLAPGDSVDVSLAFTPPQPDKYVGELDITSSDTTNIVPVSLVGFGGGAIISCTPLTLDFGTVAANIGTSLPVICTNTGTDVPDHPEAGVILTTLLTGNTVYGAQVDPMSMNPASAAQPLAATESVQIDVTYTPTTAATDMAMLNINSNVTDGSSRAPPTVSLSGNAITEQPCTYTLLPSSVIFGTIGLGTQASKGFVISNTGVNECLVTGLNLSAGTQSVFTLTSGPVTSQRLSPPGTTPPGPYPTQLNVNLEFAPQDAGSYSGSVQFTISDPSAPHQTVNLSGTGTN